ncbi:MAG: hypothetical protein GXO61_05185, partial [Epsilonproteobacteria bacterium]|nr:hypothetical protein [Campylobacterota bacterium]
INVNPLNAYFKPTFKGLTKKALYTLFNSTIKPSLGLANHLVQLEELGKFGILERKEFDAIYKIGERAGEEDRRFWENCLKEC